MIKLLLLAILIISSLGYVILISSRVRFEYSIGIFVAFISCALFFAGILNVLPHMAWTILIGGLFSFLYCFKLFLKGKVIIPGWSSIYFLLGCFVLLFILYGRVFIHYDCFSHWGYVIKIIRENNRFPNFQDTLMFQSYPPGSAAFVYYALYITGIRAEWFQLFIHDAAILGLSLCLFPFANHRKTKLAVSLIIPMFLCSNVELDSLLVDTLLPLAALHAFSFCAYYSKDDMNNYTLFLTPLMIFPVIIKNSGLLFSLLNLLFLAVIAFSKLNKKNWLVLVLSPVTSLFLWQRHVSLVFRAGLDSKHTMSLSHFLSLKAEKTAAEISDVIRLFFHRIFSWNNRVIILLLVLVFIELVFIPSSERKKHICTKIGLFSLLTYALYSFGMLLMYIGSMPMYESQFLEGFDRYHKTIILFCCGSVLLSMLVVLSEKSLFNILQKSTAGILIVAALCSFVYFSCSPDFTYTKRQDLLSTPFGQLRYSLDRLISEYHIPEKKRYLVIIDYEKYASYTTHLLHYRLEPRKSTVYALDAENPLEIDEAYDFVLMLTNFSDNSTDIVNSITSITPTLPVFDH